MKKLFISALLAAGLAVGFNSCIERTVETTSTTDTKAEPGTFEAKEKAGMMGMMGGLIGEVTKVEGDNIWVRDSAGVTRALSITGSQRLGELQAEEIQAGDKVFVQFEEQGAGVSLHKVSGSVPTMGTFEMTDEMRAAAMMGITGEVVKVEGDNISVKDRAGVTRTFSITGSQRLGELQAETIQVGDMVYVQSAEQGEKISIIKIGEGTSGTMMEVK